MSEGNNKVEIRPRYTPQQLKRNRIFLAIFFSIFILYWISIPISNHLSFLQTIGFMGFLIGPAALVLLFIYFTVFVARDGRIAERKDWAKSQGVNYVDIPEKSVGCDITIGSVIASGGDIDWPYDSLLSGTRNNHAFRAVDYGYYVTGPRGGGNMTQTVVCIDLPNVTDAEPFCLIAPDLMEHCLKAKKIRFDQHLVSSLLKNRILVVNQTRSKDPHISYEFLRAFRHMPEANVEFLGDRLLVYRIYQKLTGDNYLEWIDYAISLAEQLHSVEG